MEEHDNSRRKFIGNAIKIGVAGSVGLSMLGSSCKSENRDDYNYPPLLPEAPGGRTLKAGLIGCGSRGTGAAIDFLNAGPSLEITALADVFPDKLKVCREALKKEKGIEIDDSKCFVGFYAYEKLIDSGVDIVLLATPPHFRPVHFEAAVNASKHVFMEKPVAVDPVGARSIMINGKKAEAKGLTVIAGTIKRHQKDYVETFRKVRSGEIGEIVSANTYYNQGRLWYKKARPEWTEMEAMLRDWVNWCWLSGDHIVEQHVHNLDVINWFLGSHPLKALGMGARHRRLTGNQYDFFSIDFVYENNVHVHSLCRQIPGCSNNVSDSIRGTNGFTNCENTIYNHDKSVKWKYPLTEEQENDRWYFFYRAYIQEHIDLITSIRNNMKINEAVTIAESSMTGIMGRISAYTGKEVTWDELMNSELKMAPSVYTFGNVNIDKKIPVPGKDNG